MHTLYKIEIKHCYLIETLLYFFISEESYFAPPTSSCST